MSVAQDADVIDVYGLGICALSVCVPADWEGERIEAAVNHVHPTGLAHGWAIAEEAAFADGTPMPAPCTRDRDRRHWLLHC